MHAPLEKILDEFNISREVKEALLEGSGKYGRTFLFVKSIEECNQQAIDLFLNFYRIEKEDYEKMIYETSLAVNRLDEELASLNE
jgi:c-di-GMP-related signal transduction protein